MASIDHLHQESITLKVRHHSDILPAQYLVNCMEEEHVGHRITTQEPRTRPMKETLHSRHHSGRKPPEPAHTHTQLLGNNRVLNDLPPQIADEEQRLNRGKRCTLLHLRSGHCHLLQDYKHTAFAEPSNICTECGASPQDVRHLLACNTHPTDLSPNDPWRNPVGSIREFIYLDDRNLD